MIDRSIRPSVAAFSNVRLDFPKPSVLSCGIPIWVIDGGVEDICQLNVYITGGTIHEQMPLQSLLTALMVLEGSKQYDSREIAELLDYHGAWKLAQNHDAMCQLTLSAMNEYYQRLLPFVVDGLAQPTFPEHEFEQYKKRYAASYATMQNRVKYLAAVELRRLYYGAEHPLVADVEPERLMQMSVDDLKQFFARYYHQANCQIIIAGKVTDKMLADTDAAFSAWTDNHGKTDGQMDWNFTPSSTMLSVVDKPGAIQAAVAMAIQAVGRNHPDYLKLRMLCMVLGGYFGSRLMSNIREEKGYTYGINAFLSGREQDGYVGVSTECDVRYTWQLIDEVKWEMQRLREQLIPEDELALVRQFMLSEQVKTHDTPFNVAGYVASTLLYGVYPE